MKQRLNSVHDRDDTQAGEEAKQIQQELEFLLDQEDTKWKHRAKANWLRHGDRNTKFYHACANQRRKLNQILKIEDEAGASWESPNEIQVAFVNYFSSIFSAGPIGDMEPCMQPQSQRVMEATNDDLLKVFTKEEVGYALKQMAPLKAPGPDGLPIGFSRTIGS